MDERVGTGDDVWVLGDFALGKIAETLPIAGQLHGRKVLITGNHDRCWAGHGRRADQWEERYLGAGFAEVRHGAITIELDGDDVLACHFPYRGDSQERDRYVEQRPADRGRWLLHGHIHERWRQRGRMINVGVDAWAYRPISAAELRQLIDQAPQDLEPLPLFA